jgi:hypothetical protein
MSSGRGGYEVKCSTLRAHLAQVEKLAEFPAIREKLPPETRQVIDALPLPTAWVDGMVMQDLMAAIEAVAGGEGARQLSLRAQEAAIAPLLMPIIGGVMRLFGTTPSTMLSRFDDLTRTQVRGLTIRWEPDGSNAGRLVVTFPHKRTRRAAFIGFETACENMIRLCGYQGKANPVEINNEGTIGTIRVDWKGK